MSAKSNNKLPDPMPEAFVSDVKITRAVKAGGLRKLGTRLYNRNLSDPPEAIVSRNLWQIVAGYFPGALIADRTALENARQGPEDARDVPGTWRIVSDEHEMQRTPKDASALEELLRSRHATSLESRPDKNPGAFKQEEPPVFP